LRLLITDDDAQEHGGFKANLSLYNGARHRLCAFHHVNQSLKRVNLHPSRVTFLDGKAHLSALNVHCHRVAKRLHQVRETEAELQVWTHFLRSPDRHVVWGESLTKEVTLWYDEHFLPKLTQVRADTLRATFACEESTTSPGEGENAVLKRFSLGYDPNMSSDNAAALWNRNTRSRLKLHMAEAFAGLTQTPLYTHSRVAREYTQHAEGLRHNNQLEGDEYLDVVQVRPHSTLNPPVL
jgi:hypothetical protein